ncbi:UDP-N-acetylmuramate dehydrogenase [Candidatus Dependentiae bacterium]|nr:UDP-N-acetylmuramate dehydrogenase [Candidatus Dependentiae bacterium]MBU4386948.1 UDP-N-acetylmuramate dehydrogenase [Candidatus Dependentiae bacterium]MCG2756258.1 UDP-N-acetylmuramate dehydrogenase [Candidatus Dependentiae bacterium]
MKILENISLKDKNWFKTGGNSKFFCEPETEHEFVLAITFANKNNLEIFVLGDGANLLISDNGFNGLTIRPKLRNITVNENMVTAQAGVEIQDLINFCLDDNLLGIEDFSCIPGSIGGAVYINIHYFEKFLSDYLISAQIIDSKTGEIIVVNKSWFNFGYDQSKLQNKNYFLVSATFELKKCDNLEAAYAKGRSHEIIRYRQRQYPTSNTCGSFFRNFYENEVSLEINGKKMIFVAYYLDKLGIKGNLKIGGAQISFKHANMIVTDDTATSQDVINLAKEIQNLVFKNYKIKPIAECQLIGFDENTL